VISIDVMYTVFSCILFYICCKFISVGYKDPNKWYQSVKVEIHDHHEESLRWKICLRGGEEPNMKDFHAEVKPNIKRSAIGSGRVLLEGADPEENHHHCCKEDGRSTFLVRTRKHRPTKAEYERCFEAEACDEIDYSSRHG
jgi:hypothetical protein